MEVRATRVPGQRGTKQLHQQYGDPLVCVRYRYSKENNWRITSVELIDSDDLGF